MIWFNLAEQILACLLMANDIRKMKAFKRLLELPPDKRYHFFICRNFKRNLPLFVI